MKELKCPKCGALFTVDEEDYASIVNQVKTQEFQQELERRMKELDSLHRAEQQADKAKAEQDFQRQLSAKEAAIVQMKEQLAALTQAKKMEGDAARNRRAQEIVQLKSSITQADDRLKIAVLEEKARAQEALRQKLPNGNCG